MDSLMDGAVVLEQPAPADGYRFNADAVLLATFAMRGRQRVGHLVDLGAGVGAVGLCAAHLGEVQHLTLVDSDPIACGLARANAHRAARASSTRVVECDVDELGTSNVQPAELVVMNPPYTEPRAGRSSPVASRDRARRGCLEPFVRAAAKLMSQATSRGYVCMPAGSLVHLLRTIEAAGLFARCAAFVYPSPDSPARIVLLEMAIESGPFKLDDDWTG